MSEIYTHFEMRFSTEEEAKKVFPFVSDYLDLAKETDYRIEIDGCIIKDDGGVEGCGFASKNTTWDSEDALWGLIKIIEKEFGFVPKKSYEINDYGDFNSSWLFYWYKGNDLENSRTIKRNYDKDDPYEEFDIFDKKTKDFFLED